MAKKNKSSNAPSKATNKVKKVSETTPNLEENPVADEIDAITTKSSDDSSTPLEVDAKKIAKTKSKDIKTKEQKSKGDKSKDKEDDSKDSKVKKGFKKIPKFIKEVKLESKKIIWNPWKSTLKSTGVVLLVVLLVLIFVWPLDLGLSELRKLVFTTATNKSQIDVITNMIIAGFM